MKRGMFSPRMGFMQCVFEHQCLISFEKGEKIIGIVKIIRGW